MNHKESETYSENDLQDIANKIKIHTEISYWLGKNHNSIFSHGPPKAHYATVEPPKLGEKPKVKYFTKKSELLKYLALNESSAYISRYYNELILMY